MLSIFKNKQGEVVADYETIIDSARNPLLYTLYGVPDTPYGRFQMIALHAAPYIMKYHQDNKPAQAQKLFDLIFNDVELSFREIGVGDMSVPKKMKKYMQAFNGVVQAHAAHQADHIAITQRNVYGDELNIHPAFQNYIKGLFS